jgi:hypothetical protein
MASAVQVDVVLTVGFSFQINATFGFDASGVHGLIADGFAGLANANNWGMRYSRHVLDWWAWYPAGC